VIFRRLIDVARLCSVSLYRSPGRHVRPLAAHC